MPFYQKQLRSGVGANVPPSTMYPGQLAVNTASRRLWAGDANGTEGSAMPILLTPITLYNSEIGGPTGDYAEGDLVVDSGDIYKVAADGSLTLYVPPAGTFGWGLHLQGSAVPGWTAGPEDGLILERSASAQLQFVVEGTAGVASINFGNASSKTRGQIQWNNATNGMRFLNQGALQLNVTNSFVNVLSQLRAYSGDQNNPSISFAGDPTLGFFYAGSGIAALAQGGELIMRWDQARVQSYKPIHLNNDGSNNPNITFSGDTDTGIGQDAPNSMEFLAGGTTVMTVFQDNVKLFNRLEFEFDSDIIFDSASTPRKEMLTFRDTSGDFAIGYLENVSYGDVQSANCLTFTAGDLDLDGFMWGDAQNQASMTLSNRGVLQVRLAMWVGVDGDTLDLPSVTPPSVFCESSVNRTYTTANSTVCVAERQLACYMSIIGTSAAGINFGDASSETAAGVVMDMNTRQLSLTVDSQPLMEMSNADGVKVNSSVLKANAIAATTDVLRLDTLPLGTGTPDPAPADSATNLLRGMNVVANMGTFTIDGTTLPPSVAAPIPGEANTGVDIKELLALLVEFGREADVRMTGIGA